MCHASSSGRSLSLKQPCWNASLLLPRHDSDRIPRCRITHFILFFHTFSYYTLVVIIGFHNWYRLQTHRLACWLSFTSLQAPTSTSVSSTTSQLTSAAASPLMHSIPPTSPTHLTKPEGTIGPLSVLSAMPELHSRPLLTSPSHRFGGTRRPAAAKWRNGASARDPSAACAVPVSGAQSLRLPAKRGRWDSQYLQAVGQRNALAA